jgi:hypothetical protein
MLISLPALYLLYSFTLEKNLPNLDDLFRFLFGNAAEKILSWIKVK